MKTTFAAAALAAFATSTVAKPISRPHKRQSQRDPNLDISSSLQNILDNTHGSNLYTYPTDLTRGIIPVSPPVVPCMYTFNVLPPESHPFTQRLLAGRPLLLRPLVRLHLDRG